MASVDPTDLVKAALGGEPNAWRALVDQYSGLVWSIIRSMALRDADQADVYQNVFLKLTQHLSQVNPLALPGWLVTVTRNECYDVARQRKRLPIPDEDITHDSHGETMEDPADRAVDLGDTEIVLRALKRLSPRCQSLLRLLSSPQEFSYAQISEILEMPVGSIGPTRGRCLEQLASTPEFGLLARVEEGEFSDG